ncbi:cation-translocating P-type ATPase [Streptomyces sp. NPDC001380]|uniref:cation-translocating P-type ATPase n=1 Tax=Streptomyces sp. NPDC001380 TaxID=3364566 RepID=UPI00369692D1
MHGPNRVEQRRRVPLRSRVAAQLRDPLILVLLAAVVLTVATGDQADAVVIALVVVANTTVGVAQEVRADSAVEALTEMSAPTARVLRDGSGQRVPAAEVVPGDVLLLGEGDVVAADAALVEASALLVDESAVTGESVPVEKAAAGAGAVSGGTGAAGAAVAGGAAGAGGQLQAGTVVVHGRGVAEVTATGAASTLGRIAALLEARPQRTPLQRRLADLGRVLALTAVALCLVVFASGLARGQGFELMAVTAVSLAVAAVPESLPAVVTLSLALGARRMAARHAVVRRLHAVETLGSVTVLATDKTGTLTEGRMAVGRVWTPYGSARLTGTGYRPVGEVLVEAGTEGGAGAEGAAGADGPDGRDGRPDRAGGPGGAGADAAARAAVRAALEAAALCNDASLRPPAPGTDRWTALGDPTEAALLAAAAKAGLDRDALVREQPRIAEAPFDSARRRMTTLHRRPSGRVRVCLKGAPEAVLDPAVVAEPPAVLERARTEAARLARDGFRVLAVAGGGADGPDPSAAESGLRLLGLVGIDDPPKAAAAGTLAACRAAGIVPVLVTGDHPATARSVAVRLGLLDGDGGTGGGRGGGPDGVVTGGDLAAGRVGDITRVRVFARTSPEQKVDVVQAWRDRGQVTAMTGDGVNDGPALRRADIGVAMGRRGTEVARQAADLVLADDELGTVVAAVEEGRRVYDNIRRFLLYGLAGGAAEILVMLTGPLLGPAVPLRAGQILWINLLTHGLTGVAMGAEPASPRAMRRPPRPPEQHVLGDGLWAGVLELGVLVTAVGLGAGLWVRHGGGPWQTTLFLALLAAQLGVCAGLRERWRTRENPYLPLALAASAGLGLAAVYVPALRAVLETVPLGGAELLAAAAAGVAAAAAARLVRRRARRRDARTDGGADARTDGGSAGGGRPGTAGVSGTGPRRPGTRRGGRRRA